MVKRLGLILIMSSILALIVGAYIDSKYLSAAKITGNVYDYFAGFIFSYSIVSFIVGAVFLFRV